MTAAVAVVPCWNGARWLPACLGALRAQTRPFDRVVVVDNGSADGSARVAEELGAEVVRRPGNEGFAAAANRGIAAAEGAAWVALVNTDVELAPDWHARVAAAGAAAPDVAAVACKMVSLRDPSMVDDAGDFLRRDGVCEQRGRGHRDDGRWDAPGEVFSACAGAALYRRAAVLEAGGFDERLFSYLEDVELGLRLRLAGWRAVYEPRAVARHAGGGSSGELARPVAGWVERNTLLLVARAFPARWLGPVLYRQAAWLAAAARGGTLRAHLGGACAALPLLPAMLRERRALRARATVPIEAVVDDRPWRGPRAGGHPRAGF